MSSLLFRSKLTAVLLPVILAKPGAEWASIATPPRYNEEQERGENQPGENGKATHVWTNVHCAAGTGYL